MFDPILVRRLFPAFQQTHDGFPVAFFDSPAGTQCPQMVLDAMLAHLVHDNANRFNAFATSQRTERMLVDARQAMADMLGAASPDEIVFGPNMTTLTFAVARAITRRLSPGDEVVVTRLDHDANITPWVLAADEAGAVVRWADIREEDCTLDLDALGGLMTDRTRVVAVGYASNSVGTINDVQAIVKRAREAGAVTFVDAVQYAPHGPIDVRALGCDLLACSAYKFYGPHVGVLFGRLEMLESLNAWKVRPAPSQPPSKFETGTQNLEGIAGTRAAVEYLGVVGGGMCQASARTRRERVTCGLQMAAAYERELTGRLLDGLESIKGLRVYGITDRARVSERVPVVSFTLAGHHPRTVATSLAARGLFACDGHYYALALVERLGLAEAGGMVRVGLAHYNTSEDINRLVAALDALASPAMVTV
jgi:cysteine desulfurase family protein (TIGR01976 family)